MSPLVLLALAGGTAQASQRITNADLTAATLRANGRGDALVEYRTTTGVVRRVLAWGAVSTGDLSPAAPTRLQLDYTGGIRSRGRAVWRSFGRECAPYDGPTLPDVVVACKAGDGSYWALQRWQRVQPLRGMPPFRPEHSRAELRLSHWSGPVAQLEVSPNWTYGGRLQGLFGRLLYGGQPVFGSSTPSVRRDDTNARYVYIDTFNSAYGPGWKRDGAKVTHVGNGAFCYSFAPLERAPAGYPAPTPTFAGTGQRHRVTVAGPALTPDLQWEGPALGSYNPAADSALNALFDRLVGADPACARER